MRIQVNLSDEMVEKADYYSKKMGVTRASLCTMLIGQGLMSYENAVSVINELSNNLSESLLAKTQKGD